VRKRKIKTASRLTDLFQDQIPSDAQFKQDFEDFDDDAPQFARYVLHKINHFADKGEFPERPASKDPGKLSLEHILPEGAKPSEWPAFHKDLIKLHVPKLGNLTLLLDPINKALKDAPFEKKASFYGGSTLPITNELFRNHKIWSPETIAKRQKRFAEIAPKIWPKTLG
jgi:hypothetical protein